MNIAPLLALGLALAPCSVPGQQAEGSADAAVVDTNGAISRYHSLLKQEAAIDKEIHEIVFSISDKGTADAAATRLQDCMQRMTDFENENSGLYQSLTEDLEAGRVSNDELDAYYQAEAGGNPNEETQARLQELAELETPYYGSEALAGLMSDSCTADYGVSEEQINIACAHMDAILTKLGEIKEVLLGVKDKETADAAAVKVSTLLDEVDAAWEVLEYWAQINNIADSISYVIQESYADQWAVSDELEAIVAELESKDPAYYGSDALKNVLQENAGETEDNTGGEASRTEQ